MVHAYLTLRIWGGFLLLEDQNVFALDIAVHDIWRFGGQ